VGIIRTTSDILGDVFGFLGLSNTFEKHSQINKIVKQVPYKLRGKDFVFSFYLTEPIVVTDYTPENIFTCLAKIGAFFALGRVFVLVSLYNEYKFEKGLESPAK